MISRIDVTDAVLAVLRAGIEDKEIGDHQAPGDSTTELPNVPYAVVYAIPGGDVDGPPLGDMFEDASMVYQVTSVGERRNQCEWMAEKVREVLVGRDSGGYSTEIAVDGAVVVGREVSFVGGVTLEGDRFNATEQYVLHLTSA